MLDPPIGLHDNARQNADPPPRLSLAGSQERDRRYRWLLRAVAASTLLLAITDTINGSVRSAAVWWVLVILWIVILGSMPHRQRRILSNATHAETEAERFLRPPPTA